MKRLLLAAIFFTSQLSYGAGKIQNEDVKSEAELVSAGGTAAQLINDSKIWMTSVLPAQKLSTAVTAGLIGGGGGDSGKNYLVNSSFEGGTSSWTLSSGSGAANTSDFHDGVQSLTVTPSGAGSMIQSVTTATNLEGTNLMSGMWVKTTKSDVSVCSLVNAVEQQCVNVEPTNSWKYYVATMVGPALTTSIGVKIKWGSTGSTILTDQSYVGQNTNIVSVENITDWKDFPSVAAGTLITATTTNPTYGTVDENIAQYRMVGDSAEIRWSFKSTVAGTAGSGNYLFNIPSSICVIDTAKTGTNGSARNQKSVVGHFKMVYGTTTVATGSAHVYNSSQIYFESAYVNSSAGVSAGPWGSSFLSFTAAESISALITVPCQGRSSNVSAAKADQTNYGWTSYTPTFTGLGTVTISSANDCKHKRDGEDLLIDCKFTTGTHTATEARMSLPGSLTSAAFPSIKSAGGQVVARSETTAASVLPLIEPSVTYLTFGSLSGSTASLTKVNGNTLASSITYSLFARVPISGWTENQKAPVLVGSVTSAATSPLRVEFVSFGGSTVLNSSCTSTPCTIWNQSGAISSVTRSSAGQYVVNFASGTWSVVPTCVYTGFLTDHKVNTSATLTTVGVSSRDSSFTFADGQTNQVICFGPR